MGTRHTSSYSKSPQGSNSVATVHSHGNYDGTFKNESGREYKVIEASIIRKREMGSSIYEVREGTRLKGYSYTEAAMGEAHKAKVSIPSGSEQTVAIIHSHGGYDGIWTNENGQKFRAVDNDFSFADKKNVKKLNVVGFLTTPNGRLLEYAPLTNKTNILSKELPSDPKDPTRQNKVMPTDNISKSSQSVFVEIINAIKELFK